MVLVIAVLWYEGWCCVCAVQGGGQYCTMDKRRTHVLAHCNNNSTILLTFMKLCQQMSKQTALSFFSVKIKIFVSYIIQCQTGVLGSSYKTGRLVLNTLVCVQLEANYSAKLSPALVT